MQQEEVDNQVLLQRIRNRMIESLEVSADFEQQWEYQRSVPWVNVPTEIIECWSDCYHGHDPTWLSSPVFTADEVAAVTKFDHQWRETVNQTPRNIPNLSDVQQLETWKQLRAAAQLALAVLAKRGRLSESERV